jgi:hypothetical protein
MGETKLLAVPAGPLPMTRAFTSALGPTHPAMAAGWGDPDSQEGSLSEDEHRRAVREYLDRLRR